MQEQRAHHAEDCAVGANADPQRSDRRNGEGRGLGEAPQRQPQVVEQVGLRRGTVSSPSNRVRLRRPLLLALLVRLALFLVGARDPERYLTLDARLYLAAARDFFDTYVAPRGPGVDLGLFITPGYPALLNLERRLFGEPLHAVILVQLALGVCTIAAVARIAGAWFGEPQARRAAYLLALDPCSALYCCFVQPEALFTLSVVLATLMLVTSDGSSWRAPAAGALLALAAFTRPAGLYLPLALGAGWLLARRSWQSARSVAWMALAFLPPVLLWVARNERLAGIPRFTTIEAANVLLYRSAGALSIAQGITLEEAQKRLLAEVEARLGPRADRRHREELERAVGLSVLREHPIATAATFAIGLGKTVAGSGLTALERLLGSADPEATATAGRRVMSVALWLPLGALYLCAGWGCRWGLRRDRRLMIPLACLAYFSLTALGLHANTRFRFPMAPFLALLGAAAPLPLRAPRPSA
jgi:4-amino-4-deoxy-L-arabinose transferase-like glycosyltransferase